MNIDDYNPIKYIRKRKFPWGLAAFIAVVAAMWLAAIITFGILLKP